MGNILIETAFKMMVYVGVKEAILFEYGMYNLK